MGSIDREELKMAYSRARAVREVWLRDRKEKHKLILTANVEIRKNWQESDAFQAKSSR
jgi:hypothetical protein